jgi:fimbrial chaperone protein
MPSAKTRLRALLLAAALIGPAAETAVAGTFNADPVHLVLRGNQRSTSLEITNLDSAQPLSVRIVPLEWRQENGEDVYGQTRNVIVSPPIFTLPPGGKQVVRLGLRARGGSPAYRVLVQEIPSGPPEPGTVQLALEMNLPLYLVPNEKAQPQVTWSLKQSPDGELLVESRNDGAKQATFYRLTTSDKSGNERVIADKLGVVLPSSFRRWKAGRQPDLLPGTELPLTVSGADGETQVRVVVEKP